MAQTNLMQSLAVAFTLTSALVAALPTLAADISNNVSNTIERTKPVPSSASNTTIVSPTTRAPADITLPPSQGIKVPDDPKKMVKPSSAGELSAPREGDEHMPPSSLPRHVPHVSSSTGNQTTAH